MSALCNRPKGARFAPFGLSLCLFALLPGEIGFQDIAALRTRQNGVAERPHLQKSIGSTFSTIQVASFSFPRPIGTSIPRPAPHFASFNSESDPLGQIQHRSLAVDFPAVNRALKGDRLALFYTPPSPEPPDLSKPPDAPATSNISVRGAKTVDSSSVIEPTPLDEELQAALEAPPLDDEALALEGQFAAGANANSAGTAATNVSPSPDDFLIKTASLFFGNGAMGATSGKLERWHPGEEPIVVTPNLPADTDLKINAAIPTRPGEDTKGGESTADKGRANAGPKRQKTPAERLGLEGKARTKAETCLTEAVYFEARGEAVRGQIAVAQVVMNRVFSGFYPTTVCGVIYQNARRHLACQFTFACDRVADVVREPDMWQRAKKIAKATLDGQLWLPEVAKSTHYHAYWVRPSWVHEMKKTYKYGVHTFYRPRAWGDGSEAPSWSNATETAAVSAKL